MTVDEILDFLSGEGIDTSKIRIVAEPSHSNKICDLYHIKYPEVNEVDFLTLPGPDFRKKYPYISMEDEYEWSDAVYTIKYWDEN